MKQLMILAITLLSFGLHAQGYTTAAGIRLGSNLGVTLQQRIAKKVTLQGLYQTNFRDKHLITGLVQRHHNIITKSFNYYYGIGMHKGWENTNAIEPVPAPWGVTGVLGIELTIGRLNLSFDYKPALNIQGGTRRFSQHTGVSIRHVFVKPKRKSKPFFNRNKKKSKT